MNAGKLVRIELGPQSVLVVAKRRHAAFRGNPRAAEHRDSHATKIAGLRHTDHVKWGESLRVDPRAGKPLFDQLRSQLIEGIRTGTLPPGTRLPTVRELAGQLSLAANTVARTYRELESAGVVETRGRFGTFVARVDPADAAMAAAAQAYLSTARSLGLGKAEALRYLDTLAED
jgi:DNA-binding transcriptional regulator YhcF (GntR family)